VDIAVTAGNTAVIGAMCGVTAVMGNVNAVILLEWEDTATVSQLQCLHSGASGAVSRA